MPYPNENLILAPVCNQNDPRNLTSQISVTMPPMLFWGHQIGQKRDLQHFCQWQDQNLGSLSNLHLFLSNLHLCCVTQKVVKSALFLSNLHLFLHPKVVKSAPFFTIKQLKLLSQPLQGAFLALAGGFSNPCGGPRPNLTQFKEILQQNILLASLRKKVQI